jgi:hypothetical protein
MMCKTTVGIRLNKPWLPALRWPFPMCSPGQGPVQVWAELPCSPHLKTFLMMS